MLQLTIEVSPDATEDLCGDCLFIDAEGAWFCRLFGCEDLEQHTGEMIFSDRKKNLERLPICKQFEESGLIVSENAQCIGP